MDTISVEEDTRLSLKERIADLAANATGFRDEIYRSASPRYATSRQLVTGDGAKRFGGRWNPAGVAAVYGSLTPQIALEETLAHARYYGLPINTSMPRIFVAIRIELSQVLDLTLGNYRRTLRISEKRMLECDWRAECALGREPITQQIGRLAAVAGLEAILVRSSADDSGFNLVVFPDNLHKTSRIAVVSPDRLDS